MLLIKGGERLPKSEVIETPSFGLNYVLGGGFWTGRFSLLWGNPSSGKSTMLFHSLANAQKKGYTPVIVDAEGSYTDTWAERCGLDLDNRIYMKSNTLEEILKEVIPLMKSDNKYIFLIDSVNAIAAQNFYDNKGGIASDARSRRQMFQHFAEYLHPVNNAVWMVSQQTLDISGQHPRMMAKIGNAEHHWCTNIIRLFGSSAKDSLERADNDMITNKEVRWTIDKSKQAPVEGTTGHYWFSPQSAEIDFKKEIVNISVANGIIEKRGTWFVFNDNKVQGLKALCEKISDSDLELLIEKISSIELIFEAEDE